MQLVLSHFTNFLPYSVEHLPKVVITKLCFVDTVYNDVGLSEVVGGLGVEMLQSLMPDIMM